MHRHVNTSWIQIRGRLCKIWIAFYSLDSDFFQGIKSNDTRNTSQEIKSDFNSKMFNLIWVLLVTGHV